MCEKDYSLLRPFDLGAAENGELVTSINTGNIYSFVAKGGPDNFNVIRDKSGNLKFILLDFLRMAPLCWVEGRPVYKGDVLYANGVKRIVSGMHTDRDGDTFIDFIDRFNAWISGPCGGFGTALTWTQPKVKREGWINIYNTYQSNGKTITVSSYAYPTRKDADAVAEESRKACIHIEWEE